MLKHCCCVHLSFAHRQTHVDSITDGKSVRSDSATLTAFSQKHDWLRIKCCVRDYTRIRG